MEKIIDTGKSFLSIGNFSNMTLLEQCIIDVKDELIDKQEIIVYGRICHQNRAVGFFSDDSLGYRYSGQIAGSVPLSNNMKQLLNEINALFSSEFNGILVNRYNNGEDYIGPHSDNEKGLDTTAGVVSVSYGAVRKFRIRNKNTKALIKDVPTTSGILIQMGGAFQKEFIHEVPLEKRVTGMRYSFTFRKHET